MPARSKKRKSTFFIHFIFNYLSFFYPMLNSKGDNTVYPDTKIE
ncbi:hypothetical protein PARMER_01592 [Parabacteroides merdae ATCC 43184]|nr:hypothetical protein PARMER_01592 [Parabacteroides merdae ATCC 43184]